jgi:hypothetical protein
MKYEVVESKVWKHKVTGRLVSLHGASPWENPADRANWEITVTGWTVYNPLTGEYGIGRKPWATRFEAQQFADSNIAPRIGIGG